MILFDLTHIMSMIDPIAISADDWFLGQQAFQNFEQNIKCSGIH